MHTHIQSKMLVLWFWWYSSFQIRVMYGILNIEHSYLFIFMKIPKLICECRWHVSQPRSWQHEERGRERRRWQLCDFRNQLFFIFLFLNAFGVHKKIFFVSALAQEELHVFHFGEAEQKGLFRIFILVFMENLQCVLLFAFREIEKKGFHYLSLK